MAEVATLIARSRVAASLEMVFAWHARPGSFERLLPPWGAVKVVSRTGGVRAGDRMTIEVSFGPMPIRCVYEYLDYVEGRQIRVTQVSGMFKHYTHLQRLEPEGDGCVIEDTVEYEPHGGVIAQALGGDKFRQTLARAFRHRHAVVARDLALHAGTPRTFSVAIGGASGFLGRHLAAFLSAGGHRVLRLVRRRAQADDEVAWSPQDGGVEAAKLDGVDAIVNLAGENIGEGRWSDERKRRIRDSRVQSTDTLARAIASMERPPRVFVSASAVGYYGDGDQAALDEGAPAGRDFLADVAAAWEAAAAPARSRGVRVVHPRLGTVLHPQGGVLAKLLPPFQAGLGGRVGSGEQILSWIAMDDALAAFLRVLTDESFEGPVNFTSPEPVSNGELARTLGELLNRPAMLPLPAVAVDLFFGEMGRTLLLQGARVVPGKLARAGFGFAFGRLHDALTMLLGKADLPAAESDSRVSRYRF